MHNGLGSNVKWLKNYILKEIKKTNPDYSEYF